MRRLLLAVCVLCLASLALAGQNPDINIFLLFQNGSNSIQPTMGQPITATIYLENFGAGGGVTAVALKLDRWFGASMQSYTNLLGGSSYGDPESGWLLQAGTCKYPDGNGRVAVGSVSYVYQGSPGALEFDSHPAWGRAVFDCSSVQDDWCVRKSPSGNGGVWETPPEGDCFLLFEDIGAGITGVDRSSVAWGDYDNDGDLDILLAGYDGAQRISRVYRNTAGAFVNSGAVLTAVQDAAAAWGDYDGDGDLDILLTGHDGSAGISRVYRNDAGVFANINAGLAGVYSGSVAWGDCDNDGDLDILLTGAGGSQRVSNVYRNDEGVFANLGAGLSGVYASSVAWGDYDKDGDLDILLTGDATGGSRISRIYRNDSGAFVNIGAGLTGIYYGSVAWGDYDNDGDLDILLTGNSGSILVSRVYRNDAGVFANIGAGLTGVSYSSGAWGDYDNDGDLDVLLSGATETGCVSMVYRNDAGSFPPIEAGLIGVYRGSLGWGDYDNDHDLDILITGYDGSSRVSRVYSNNIPGMNSVPSAPANLTAATNGNTVTLAWDAATDEETPSAGLTYNVRIAMTPGGSEIMSAMANAATGYRRVARLGNTNHEVTWRIQDLPEATTYYWSVQAVDAAFAGSAFAAERSFLPAFTDIGAGLPSVFASSADWGDYDNDGDLDILLAGYAGSGVSRVYRNDAGVFRDRAAGLPGVWGSTATWGDYDNDGDLDVLLAGWTGTQRIARVYRNDSLTFADIGAGLQGIDIGSGAWGDYDNDGDLDILIAGRTNDSPTQRVSSIYRNDAEGFRDISAGLPGAAGSSVAWGDYDNDGDLDILLAGSTATGDVARVYRNDGGAFADAGAGLAGATDGTVAWGDYDNDGDLDILRTGLEGTSRITRIYRNSGGLFTDIGAGLVGIQVGAAAWGDYDDDGDLDVLLSGATATEYLSKLYRNDAGVFRDAGAMLPAVGNGTVDWGDYDNDGDLDILLTGGNEVSELMCSRIYRNNTSTPNTPPAAPTNLTSEVDGNTVTFSWGAATDAETPSPGLTYNLRIGTAPGGSDILSAMADAATGYRRVPRLGSTNHRTAWTVRGLPYSSAYYWSVQTVDAAFAGSAFAAQESCLPTFTKAPLSLWSESAQWGDYDNDGDLDLLIATLNIIYRNDSGVFRGRTAGLCAVFSGSSDWGDYDNDGDLDVLLSGIVLSPYQYVSRVYRNDTGGFRDIDAGLIGVEVPSVAWGDYDNDGDLDILLAGWADGSYATALYRNDAGSFGDIEAGLPDAAFCSLAWGDYDTDGDLDILLTGDTPFATSRVYRNDACSFADISAGLAGVRRSSAAWGDYDNDGDLDILLSGEDYYNTPSAFVYRNDGGVFSSTNAGLVGVFDGSAAWGDYDNDGDLDIALTGGGAAGQCHSRVCRNDEDVFTDIGAGLTGAQGSTVSWGDYDNDGDLDIAVVGQDSIHHSASGIYRNNTLTPNTPPVAPSNLSVQVVGSAATFSWDAATDAQTPSPGLTYNLRVGRTPGGSEIVGPMADLGTGYRRVAQLGNTNHRRSWAVHLPVPVPCFYWSVQAVDAAFAGSAFAPGGVGPTGVAGGAIPTRYALHTAVPNPFNPVTAIRYDLPEASVVTLEVFDISGRRVCVLRDGAAEPAGAHEVQWRGENGSGRPVASGAYFCRLRAGSFVETRRMMLIR